MDADQKSYKDVYCSAELTGAIHNELICLSALNIFLSLTAFLGNALILVGLRKGNSLYPPSKRLFRCLASTDLCIGTIVGPLHVSYWISAVTEHWDICRYLLGAILITANMLCSVSLLTLAAISVDRLLSLLLDLRYKQMVTLNRTNVTVIIFWFVSGVGSIMSLWNELASSWCSYVIIPVCLLTSLYCYSRIFLKLRHLTKQVQKNVHGRVCQTAPFNVARYRKVLCTALWLQIALIFCYSPYIITAPVAHREIQRNRSPSVYLVLQVAITILYWNSSLNPILYYLKIRGVRQAVKDTIRHLLCL